MKGTLWYDVKAALAVLLGALLGYLVLGADDPSPLLGGLIGLTLFILMRSAWRNLRHRGQPQ